MSYKIEINADSISELAGKLLALAAQMQATPVDPVMPEVREAPKPKRAKAEKPVEVAEAPVGEPAAQQDTAASSDPAIMPESDTRTSDTGLPATNTVSPSEAVVSLDFEKDVAPLVLKAVAVKGKPWVQEVLAQFGVERASQVPDERLPELVAIVAEAV
jgi:hypothetical protein